MNKVCKRLGTFPVLLLGLLVVPMRTAQAEPFQYEDERDHLKVEVGKYEDITVYMGLKTVGRLQTFDQQDVSIPQKAGEDGVVPPPQTPGDPEWGFQNAFGSMDFKADFNKLIEVYWEFYISSRPHPSEMQGSQGYILFRGLPGGALGPLFDLVDIKAGEFEVNYGDHIYRRSSNARVQQNALIGNALFDPRATEIGVEIMTKPKAINAMVGVGGGTESEDFNEERGTSAHGKLWATPVDSVRVAISGYFVDHSGNPVGAPGGSKNNELSSSRDGGQYGGIFGGGSAPGQLFIGKGQKVSSGQFDISFKPGDLELYANVGYGEDGDINGSADGSPEEAYVYYTAEAVYDFTEKFYAALRYSAAAADKIGGVDSDGYVNRIQAGIGYWLTTYILTKVELVHQELTDFGDGEIVCGVDAGQDPTFDGILGEVSLAF